jgi:endonuclease/exonuclease/phosphatase family metal-dependent hydrolase
MIAASVLRAKLDVVQKLDKSANILIMGDFNDEPSNKSITQGIKALNPEIPYNNKNIYNLLEPEFKKGEGSLYYKDWDLFDQIIVSGNMLSRKKGLTTNTESAGIFKADYLLYKDKNGVAKPNRTMGTTYFGGYSDHLPVFVKLNLN